MKTNFHFPTFFLVIIFLVLGIPSCKKDKDKCESQYCLNGGSCNPETGKCVCPQGYSGEHCETKVASPGYLCQSGTCVQVANGAQYASLSACQTACSTPPPQGGYNCVNGNCQSVTSGAQYTSLSACQTACAGPPPSGYNCINGTCVQASGNYQHPDLASCQSNCAQQTGKVTFYKSCNFTEVSVTINGQTKQISQGFASEPLCDAPGTATFTLPTGTYTYSENPQCLIVLNREVTVTPGSCSKVNIQSSGCDPINQWNGYPCGGKISFWSHGVTGCNTISVNINGITKQITKFYPDEVPQNDNGFAVYDRLPPGKYTYTASCGNHNWAGEVELPYTIGGPIFTETLSPRIELIEPGYGKVIFWEFGNYICDVCPDPNEPYFPKRSVSINGNTKPIYNLSFGFQPHCQVAPAEAGTYFLPAGTYQYQFTKCCGGWQTALVTIYAGECTIVDL